MLLFTTLLLVRATSYFGFRNHNHIIHEFVDWFTIIITGPNGSVMVCIEI